ncbi:MAG: hypothetical protein DI619_03260 [Francisella sp.]|nr:MAG: hypothetical protein DI619_03260 [Francisella sp.]
MKNCNYKRLVILLTANVLSTACVFRQNAAPVLNSEDEISVTDKPYQPSDSDIKTATFAAGTTVASNSSTSANILVPLTYSNHSSGSNVASSPAANERFLAHHQSENGVGYLPSNAPVDLRAKTHTVVRGDTVYNLAKRYHILQDDLRAWNSLSDNTISVGQVLKVKPPKNSAGNISATSPSLPSVSKAPQPAVDLTSTGSAGQVLKVKPSKSSAGNISAISPPLPSVSKAPQPAVNLTSTGSVQAKASSTYNTIFSKPRTVGGITWIRPVAGVLTSRFNAHDRGVTIAGDLGTPIVAAADGKVIYSSQLSSYGNLVIIQHNDQYLTAYAHNQVNLVKEGVQVKRGQRIALMGNTGGASKVALHFELRKNGQAIDPAPYIPL